MGLKVTKISIRCTFIASFRFRVFLLYGIRGEINPKMFEELSHILTIFVCQGLVFSKNTIVYDKVTDFALERLLNAINLFCTEKKYLTLIQY